jgi:hypothetical protein
MRVDSTRAAAAAGAVGIEKHQPPHWSYFRRLENSEMIRDANATKR